MCNAAIILYAISNFIIAGNWSALALKLCDLQSVSFPVDFFGPRFKLVYIQKFSSINLQYSSDDDGYMTEILYRYPLGFSVWFTEVYELLIRICIRRVEVWMSMLVTYKQVSVCLNPSKNVLWEWKVSEVNLIVIKQAFHAYFVRS